MLRLNLHRTAMNKFVLAIAMVTAIGVAGVARADSGASSLPPNWHVHDGQTALGPQHKAVGFFPQILGLSTEEYLRHPAQCPDATDKVFLPNGKNPNQPLRAGICQTNTTIIQLRSIRADQQAPAGWRLVDGFSEQFDGITYVTYYKLS
jgi:hypothetical protein